MSRIIVALDDETELIGPANCAPALSCITWQVFDLTKGQASAPGIEHHSTVYARLRSWLEDPNVLIVGHNIAFDMAVIAERYPDLRPLIFAAYDANRITDTMIRQWLLDTAAGVYRGTVTLKGRRIQHTYDLEYTARRMAGIRLQKDEWRLSYGRFLDVPLERWPERARELQAEARVRLEVLRAEVVPKDTKKAHDKAIESLRSMVESDATQCLTYPLEDARATLAVYLAQEKHAVYLANQFDQTRAYFALYLQSAWGLRTDPTFVQTLLEAVQAEFDEVDEELKMLGLVRPDGTRDTKAAKARMIAVCKEKNMPVIRTDAHFADNAECGGADSCDEHICLDADACERSEDPVLIDYAERSTLGKQLSNDIPAMLKGTHYPIHTRYGFAATGRTTSSKPNIQNQSKRKGFREVYVPRAGYVFFDVDYPTLELYTLAQCCVSWLGHSRLAHALNTGLDPHLWVAAIMLDRTYEDCLANAEAPEVKQSRQLAKPANFGFPGGMGIQTFLTATRKSMGRVAFEALFGSTVEAQIKLARRLKDQWLAAWPEMEAYFERANQLCGELGRATVETLWTKRTRGNATYCATNNNGFQALGADCAKRAAWLIAKAQYVDETSPMFNSRTVAFVHDQFVGECVNDARAHDVAYECARLMVVGANEYLPDVPIPLKKMKPALSTRWSKDARPVFGEDGRLVPWAA